MIDNCSSPYILVHYREYADIEDFHSSIYTNKTNSFPTAAQSNMNDGCNNNYTGSNIEDSAIADSLLEDSNEYMNLLEVIIIIFYYCNYCVYILH